MKIKFIFNSETYGTITNDKPFIDTDDMTDEQMGGCVVELDHVPMLQEYMVLWNKIWCEQLQWDYPNNKMKDTITELIE